MWIGPSGGKTKELVVDFRYEHSPTPAHLQLMKLTTTWMFTLVINRTGATIQMHYAREARADLSAEETQVLWSAGSLLRPCFGVVCWASSISTADRKRLNRLVKKVSAVLGYPQLQPSGGGGRKKEDG